jgi:hypothetical protein
MTTIDGVIKPRRTPEPLRLLLESADSSGELGVVEMQMPPRAGGPPLHVHPTHGEGFYVLKVNWRSRSGVKLSPPAQDHGFSRLATYRIRWPTRGTSSAPCCASSPLAASNDGSRVLSPGRQADPFLLISKPCLKLSVLRRQSAPRCSSDA